MHASPHREREKEREREREREREWYGFPRHPRGTMPRRVPVFLHGGDPQEAYTMPHVLRRMENSEFAKIEELSIRRVLSSVLLYYNI